MFLHLKLTYNCKLVILQLKKKDGFYHPISKAKNDFTSSSIKDMVRVTSLPKLDILKLSCTLLEVEVTLITHI